MQTLVSTREVRRVIGVGAATIDKWVKRGLVKPVRSECRKGGRHVFQLLDILALAVARALRRRGFTVGEAAAVLEWFRFRTLGQIEREISSGRTALFVVGENVCPCLLSPESILDNDEIDFAAAVRAGVRVTVVDIGAILRRIRAEISTPQAVKHA